MVLTTRGAVGDRDSRQYEKKRKGKARLVNAGISSQCSENKKKVIKSNINRVVIHIVGGD